LLFDDLESAQSFDIERMFGRKLLLRLQEAWEEETPAGYDEYEPPDTIQEWYARTLRRLQSGRPFVNVLDSFDALSTTEEQKRSQEMASGKESGSYKMEKARWASEVLRVISRGISNTKSLVIIISQTRDNIDPIGFQKKTRAGGRALEFYASYIFWLAKLSSIARGEGVKKIKIGRNVQAKVTKTKTTGFEGDIRFPIYRQIGVDDIGASLDFLAEWSPKWQKGKTISCEELNLSGYKMDVCRAIEEQNLQNNIKIHLQEAWDAYIQSADLGRQRRF